MRSPSLPVFPLNICPRPGHLSSQNGEGLSLSLSNSKECWGDGSGISVTSFLACRESWGDRKLPDSVLSLKSLLCFGFVNSRQPVSSPRGPLCANSILHALGCAITNQRHCALGKWQVSDVQGLCSHFPEHWKGEINAK